MGKINVYDKIVMKKEKKEKIWKSKTIVHKSPPIRRFWNGIYSLLMRAEARGSADTIYCICDAYRSFAGRALLMTSQK